MRRTPQRKANPRNGSADRAVARLLGALGLAARAGHVALGAEAAEQAVLAGTAEGVIVAADAPERIRRRFDRLLSERAPDHKVVVLEGERLGHALGGRRVVAVALTDAALARKILALAEAVGSRG